jgi:hypothetical protein
MHTIGVAMARPELRSRPALVAGLLCRPVLGGLHHEYDRI